MTAKQIMDFVEENAHSKDMFGDLENDLTNQKYDILVKLEKSPNDKKLKKQYYDVCEKIRMIYLMRVQRLELFEQSNLNLGRLRND